MNDGAPSTQTTALGNDRWSESRRLFERSKRSLAGGVASSLRTAVRPTPLFVTSGTGSRLRDVDGNEYVDYVMAYGPLILGHAHPEVVAAVGKAAARGSAFGSQHEDEIAVAERVCSYVPNAELTCLTGSGTEAVLLALRLARAATGRQRVIRFHGHYHGWSDAVLVGADDPTRLADPPSPGTPGQSVAALSDLVEVTWNDEDAIEAALLTHGSEVAAIICEPILCNSGCIAPHPGYLERLRELAYAYGCLLVLDEVITGFRLGLGGAQERFGVKADLVVYGKAVAGGLPLAGVAGTEAVLGLVADGTVPHMGTLNGNTVATAAARATLDVLAREDGAAYGQMADLTTTLVAGIERAASDSGIPLVVNSVGQAFHTVFTDRDRVDGYTAFTLRDAERMSRFAELMLGEAVYVRPSGLWYLSTAHTDEDVSITLDAVTTVMGRLG